MRIDSKTIVIVGAGLSGLTLAERWAKVAKRKIILIEKRPYIGGNCYDFFNNNGILVSKYGPHVFHTNNEKVWNYIQKFAEWEKYEHRVLSSVENKLVPIPVNIKTINTLYGINLKNGQEMKRWLELVKVKNNKKDNDGEEIVIKKIGRKIFDLMYKDFTKKQWDKWPKELSADILARVPIRYSFDDRYHNDKYQVRAIGGMTRMMKKMIKNKNIKVVLNCDYFKIINQIPKECLIFFTGRIDQYVSHITKKKYELAYRSVKFRWKNYREEYHQSCGVINYPSIDNKVLRSTEYKYLTGQKSMNTSVSNEYFYWGKEAFYPVITKDNIKKYLEIKKKSSEWKNIYFVGRLGKYEYINMDQAIFEALELFERVYEKTK